MIARFLLVLSLSFLSGFFVVSILWPRPFPSRSVILRCSFAWGFGCGVSSCWFFCWLVLAAGHGSYFATFVIPEIIGTLALGLVLAFSRRRPSLWNPDDIVQPAEKKDWASRLCPLAFFVMLFCAIISFILISLSHPYGDFDAVSIWNMRSRFLARGTAHWREAFADSESLPHPDYPLLLPATIARCWKFVGCEPVLVPIVVASLFTFSSVGLLYSSLASLRSKQTAFLGGIVLLGVSSFVAVGASQYADTIIGFFVLSAISALALYDAVSPTESFGFLVLAGAAAGFCAWTKNEGLLFVLLLLVVRFLLSVQNRGWRSSAREVALITMGVLPALVVVAYFKLAVTPANFYLTAGHYSSAGPMKYFLEPGTISQKLMSVSRYWLIAKAMASEIVRLGGRTIGIVPLLLLYFLSAKLDRKSVATAQNGIVLLSLMMVGYFFVYLTTPLNLAFHLRTSLLRLLLQLLPSFVFVLFMASSPTQPKVFAEPSRS